MDSFMTSEGHSFLARMVFNFSISIRRSCSSLTILEIRSANKAYLVPARCQTGPVKVHSGEGCLAIDGRFVLVVLPYNASIKER